MPTQANNFLTSEKLFYHKELACKLLHAEESYPIHLELGLVNYCNHNCTFCYASRSKFDAMGLSRSTIDMRRLETVLGEMYSLGLKAVTLVGSGEPTLHPKTVDIIHMIHSMGLDVGLFTNGSTMSDKLTAAFVECCTFVRFSLTGASPEVHSLVHGSHDYHKITENIQKLTTARTKKHQPTIGIQFVLADYSAKDVHQAAQNAKNWGVDYFSVKPCFPSPENSAQLPNTLTPSQAAEYVDGLEQLSDEHFTVHVKRDQIERVFSHSESRHYARCLGSSIATVMESDFNMYYCANMETAACMYGSVKEDSFSDIWLGEQRRKIAEHICLDHCPPGCRMSNINRLLSAVDPHCLPQPAKAATPEMHINFL